MTGKHLVGPVKILEIMQQVKNEIYFRFSKNVQSFARSVVYSFMKDMLSS